MDWKKQRDLAKLLKERYNGFIFIYIYRYRKIKRAIKKQKKN